MKRILALSALLLSAISLSAQISYPDVRDSSTDPTGVGCTSAAPILRYTAAGTSTYFGCTGTGGTVYAAMAGGGGGAVSSVSNSDGSLTISPTTGAVGASCATASTSQLGCVKPDGTTITASGGVLTATGAGASGVQYNPSTTAYVVLGSSLWADDSGGTSTPVTATTWSCSGTACDINTATNHNLTTSNWVTVGNLSGWFAAPSFRSNADTGVGTFKVASVISPTEFTVAYTLNAGSGSGGTIASADYWQVYQAAQQPFLNGHGTTYYRFSWMSNAAAHFSSVVNCSIGTPTYLIIMGAQNDIANGDSEATIKANYQSVWSQAHAAGCIVLQGGMLSTNFGAIPNGQAATWQKLADLNQWLRLQNKTFAGVAGGQYWDNYFNVDSLGFDDRVETSNSMLSQRVGQAFAHQASDVGGQPPVFVPYGIGPAIGFIPTRWTFLGANGWDAATWFDSTGYGLNQQQNSGALGGSVAPLLIQSWPHMGAGSDGCNQMNPATTNANDKFAFCVHYTGSNSATNYFSIGLTANTNGGTNTPTAKFFANGGVQVPGLASGGGTKLVSTDASGNLGVTTAGAGTVTSSGTPVSGDLAAFTSATDITTATVTQVNTLIKTLTGCNTPTFVYTPQSGTCVSPGTPTVPVGVNYTLNTGVAASPAAVIQTAPNSGTVSACAFTTTTSDGSTDLTFNLLFNSVSILSGAACTVTHGASAGAITSCTLTGGTITITAGQNWQLNTTAGTSSWTGSVACH